MSLTWRSDDEPQSRPFGAAGWVRVAARGSAVLLVVGAHLAALFAVRMVERPLHGDGRPWSRHVVRSHARAMCAAMGLGLRVEGEPLRGPGAVVSNHVSWLDIFTLNAALPVTFVSKAEVARWPGIGFLARVAGTRFIDRAARASRSQHQMLSETLREGHLTLFFPEGTSTDGRRVLSFRSTLFEAMFTSDLKSGLMVQPLTVCYRAPPGEDPRFYGWWGDMEFGAHALKVLAQAPQGGATVVFHPPLRVADFPDRKALAAACETVVREGMKAPRGD